MNNNRWDYFAAIIGLGLLGIGLYLVRTLVNPQGFMLPFPYVCVGIGCGIFGHAIGNILTYRTIKNNPDIQKQLLVDQNDERNVAIANRAKAKAYDMMTFVLAALMISFALMGVDLAATLLLVFVYLFIQGYAIYYRCKYEKEM